ncbi:MAG: ATP synthase subunit I [Cyanobacteria bacterium J06636_16]
METPSSNHLPNAAENSEPVSIPSSNPMSDYYRLQARLLRVTVIFSVVIFVSVWLSYSLHVALNYLIGACVGVVYLRMLSKNVERLGSSSGGISGGRLALVALLILVASQWNQLEIMPAFLGFLTYKAALIGYTLWEAFPSD